MEAMGAPQDHTLLIQLLTANQTLAIRTLVELLTNDFGGPYQEQGGGQLGEALLIEVLPLEYTVSDANDRTVTEHYINPHPYREAERIPCRRSTGTSVPGSAAP